MRIKDKTKRTRNRKLKKHVLVSRDIEKGEKWWNVILNPRKYMKKGAELAH